MPKSTPSAARIVVIAGFALSCFGLLLFLWLAFGGSVPLKPEGYRFNVAFKDATTLADQADVRVAGVNIGKVVAREPAPDGERVIATLQIDQKYAPIHEDATALLRQKTLLGETYVELNLGRRGDLAEGGTLKSSQVKDVVEFDELLETFDKDTRKAFQTWQKTTAKSTEGRATDLSDALGNLPGFAGDGQTLVDILNRRRDALKGVVRDTGVTFAALSEDADALQTLITRSDTTLSTLARRREALSESIKIFPTFLTESRVTLNRMETFAKDTDPLIEDLDPVLDDLQPTLRSLANLAPDAENLFNDLPALVSAGKAGLPALTKVLRELEPTLAETGPFLQQLNPVLEFLEQYQATISNFISIGANATALKLAPPNGQNSSNGHALPQMIVLGDQSLPSTNRSPSNRGNAYFAPDALKFTQKAGDFLVPPSFDCRNSGGETKASASGPGCYEQAPFTVQGETRKFPHVTAGSAGGLTQRPPGK
jgi:phospholipid/cholesterol/gamma-HCH transport system substrate-binding protein